MLPFGTLANNVSRCKLSNNPTKNRAKHLTSATKPRVLSRLESKLDAKLSCFPLQLGMEATLSWGCVLYNGQGPFLIGNLLRKTFLDWSYTHPESWCVIPQAHFPYVASSTCLEAVIMLRAGCVWAKKCKCHRRLFVIHHLKKISQAKKELNNHTIHWQCC
jgi:hypothetical protein